jgi:carbamoyl-phosphate synthase large subunit
MPKREDLQSICVLGSGPIVIGQAAEFDYSGAQAVKALKGDGYRVVLVNSNPATIMTDPNLADATYVEPLDPEVVAEILRREKPDALLPTVGGQTALNLALSLEEMGVLEELGIELIGASTGVIEKAENRELFKLAMENIGLECAQSAICHTYEEAKAFMVEFSLPLVIRPSFTMGGSGGGIARTEEEFRQIVTSGLEQSPTTEILVEISLLGWKEYELELMRDKADNVVVVCSIENLDPMGVHTGDSITIAPAQTLSDREYQTLRNAGIAILREIGVETGGSNVQFAIHPGTGRLVIVEMNPRVSRSSALASKATGFPIAKVAAKLAVGYTLDEIPNDITQKTRAAFEPSIDYVVTKFPRFAFEKFRGAKRVLTTQMKSVGEVMSIGRTFNESLGKALRSLEIGSAGLGARGILDAGGAAMLNETADTLLDLAAVPSPERFWLMTEAIRRGANQVEVQKKTGVDPWFLAHLSHSIDIEEAIREKASLETMTADDLWEAKENGLADERIGELLGASMMDVRDARKALGVLPVMKRVDTCAGEFEAHTPYLYSTYERPHYKWSEQGLVALDACEAAPTDAKKVVILGGGPIRIGQGIEFDYCCVHASMALANMGIESIMVNCNPETVSTDYDSSDRLYFEPLTIEDVLNIIDIEKPLGVIVQFGGQTPLKLAQSLHDAGVQILGTNPDAIDRAEDRERSNALVEKLELRQPLGGIATSAEQGEELAAQLGYPVMLRPSYVLGGRAMETVHTEDELRQYLEHAVRASDDKPVLVDRFLDGAIEVDIDVVADGETVIIGGIMQHIHEAGIHSGDSACVLPPYSLARPVVEEIASSARKLALELGVIGLMNAQFAVRRNRVYVIEVNPRGSRTVPFVCKATGVPLAQIATRVMLGERLKDMALEDCPMEQKEGMPVSIKEAVVPFIKFPGVDPLLGPEMRATGEVMGIDVDAVTAFAKAQLAAGTNLPVGGSVFVSVADVDKQKILPSAKRLADEGFQILATGGTHRFLESAGIASDRINKVREGSPHVLDMMNSGDISLVFNTTLGAKAVAESAHLRRTAVTCGIPYFTAVAAADAASKAIVRNRTEKKFNVRSLQEHLNMNRDAPTPV